MSFVQRVTSVTLVTLLAVVGPSLTVHADAAGGHHKKYHKHHKHHLTAKQRYAQAHPRLIRAVTYGLRQRGDKYRFGAEGPNRWDCSGLVYFSYRKAGFRDMPRTSRQQYRAAATSSRCGCARRPDVLPHEEGPGLPRRDLPGLARTATA